MNYVTQRHISRRAVLRGMGVTIALPFLDAMVPAHTALARTAAKAPIRVGFCFIPHGAIIDQWTPAGEGFQWELSRNLKPLENVKDEVVVLTNLHLKPADSHAGIPPAFLSGAACRKTESEDVRAAMTLDQILSQEIGLKTRLPSLEIGTEDPRGLLGAWDTGCSRAYINTISWKSPTEPLPVEIRPRVVFNRLFGNGGSTIGCASSILDEAADGIKSLRHHLGAGDQRRIAEYLDDVRETERRIQFAEKQNEYAGIPLDHVEHTKLMFDLMALAYQADITRIQTFMMAHEVSHRSFPHIGAPESFHTLSHHQFDPVKEDHLINVNTYHVSQMARFLERLKNMPDGDGTLLDHSILLYGSGMGLANSHQHDDLPIFIAGGANGRLNGNRHLRYPSGEPLANLLLSIGDLAGIHIEKLGDATGRLAGL